jgi:hypothetical protein
VCYSTITNVGKVLRGFIAIWHTAATSAAGPFNSSLHGHGGLLVTYVAERDSLFCNSGDTRRATLLKTWPE